MRTEDLLKQSQSLPKSPKSQQEELHQSISTLEKPNAGRTKLEVERRTRGSLSWPDKALEDPKGKADASYTSEIQVRVPDQHSHEPAEHLLTVCSSSRTSFPKNGTKTSPKAGGISPDDSASGNDLINVDQDMLVLSKIESGTVLVEAVKLPFAICQDLCGADVFVHVADSRKWSSFRNSGPDRRGPCTPTRKRLHTKSSRICSSECFKSRERAKSLFAGRAANQGGVRTNETLAHANRSWHFP